VVKFKNLDNCADIVWTNEVFGWWRWCFSFLPCCVSGIYRRV